MALFKRKQRPEVDLEERSPQLGIKYKDLLVLDQLVKVGADMSNPRHVLYYLYFPDAVRGRAAADEVAGGGFEVELRDPVPEYPDHWALVCELRETVLELEMVRDNTDYFEALAARHGGEYDGWEASAD